MKVGHIKTSINFTIIFTTSFKFYTQHPTYKATNLIIPTSNKEP